MCTITGSQELLVYFLILFCYPVLYSSVWLQFNIYFRLLIFPSLKLKYWLKMKLLSLYFHLTFSVSRRLNILYIMFQIRVLFTTMQFTPGMCEGWQFTRMWKTLEWPDHFTKRESWLPLIKLEYLRHFWLKCLYQARNMSGHGYMCYYPALPLDIIVVLMVSVLASEGVILCVHTRSD